MFGEAKIIKDLKDQWKSYDAKFEQEQRESGLATGFMKNVKYCK